MATPETDSLLQTLIDLPTQLAMPDDDVRTRSQTLAALGGLSRELRPTVAAFRQLVTMINDLKALTEQWARSARELANH
jgi:hypothetical protein